MYYRDARTPAHIYLCVLKRKGRPVAAAGLLPVPGNALGRQAEALHPVQTEPGSRPSFLLRVSVAVSAAAFTRSAVTLTWCCLLGGR